MGEFHVLFEGELGVNLSAGRHNGYHNQCFFGYEYFRTRVTTEMLPVILSNLFPLPLGTGLVFTCRRGLSSILKVRTSFFFFYFFFFFFFFRCWRPFAFGCQLPLVLRC